MLVQNISPVNYAGNQSFTASRSKNLEAVVSTAFNKLAQSKSLTNRTYLGTTKHGENIVIQETVLGKAAKLIVSFSEKSRKRGTTDFEIFNLSRETGKYSTLTSENNEKTPIYQVGKLKRILDNLV